jgi:lipid-binding SYLF domain-containing protein
VALGGLSGGLELGAQVTDFVIILNSDAAVKSFMKGTNVTLGGSLSAAAGPYGRAAEVGSIDLMGLVCLNYGIVAEAVGVVGFVFFFPVFFFLILLFV